MRSLIVFFMFSILSVVSAFARDVIDAPPEREFSITNLDITGRYTYLTQSERPRRFWDEGAVIVAKVGSHFIVGFDFCAATLKIKRNTMVGKCTDEFGATYKATIRADQTKALFLDLSVREWGGEPSSYVAKKSTCASDLEG